MKEQTRRGPRSATFWSWDVSIDTTRPALARCMEAILETRSRLTSSLIALGGDYPLGRGVSADIRVEIAEGWEDRFRWLAHPIHMIASQRLTVGSQFPANDGHPGRKP